SKTKPKAADAKDADVDTEHIFGFIEGSDIGDAGEKEGEAVSSARLGKGSGFYAANSTALFYKYSPVDHFRIAPVISFASHNIENVPGLDNKAQWTLEGTGVELRYRLWDREKAPFGITLSALPHYNRVDAGAGLPVEQYGIEAAALLDKELISNLLFAAVNFSYEPEWTRKRPSIEWDRESTFGVGAAFSVKLSSGLFAGAEARYFRKYEGTGLNTFVGEALFVGPTVFMKLSKKWFASAAWNVQVAGHAVGEPGSLDLINFEKHEIRVRVGVDLN
ncbi:MAG TPA: hypothetical protein VKB08_09450, partial [Bradyrhizobium sp.]|nr:hypothetical protein [Bradyrhizobium sp.]